MLRRLASSSYRHPWRTLAVWLLGLATLFVVAGALGDRFGGGGVIPGTDSGAAYQLLARDLPASGAEAAQLVVQVPAADADAAAAVTTLLDGARDVARGGVVSGPITSPDGRTSVYLVEMPPWDQLDANGHRVAEGVAHDLERIVLPARAAGATVELGGPWFQQGDVPASSEWIGVGVAVVVLLIVFGSLLAVGVTLLPALLAVAASGAVLTIITHLVTTPDVTTTTATMIGLGVGIDYCLFVINRYRRELLLHEPADALQIAYGTAGRAVALAGGTVAISLLGMLLIGLEFLRGLAIGAAVAVGIAVLSTMTLLPALLRWSTRSMAKHARRRAERTRETFWHRWGRAVAARPVVTLVGGLVVLCGLGAPALSMRLASADAGNDPVTSTSRRAYDLMASAFGPGVNGPLVVAVSGTTPAEAGALADRLRATAGVASVQDPVIAPNGTTAAITLYPTTAPQSPATEALVDRIRHEVIPAAHVTAHVGGITAGNVDFAELLRRRLPLFIGGVLASSFLLLMIVFRSLLVPLKAVLLNLLSITAAWGATVAVFQWGWLRSILGVHGGAPIEPWVPMMLFAIVFGLSMDYEVFLLSAVKEHYDATGDNRTAVVEGLSGTARVITAAAAIMVAVFASFLGADLRAVQLMGFGLAIAVLIDATVVRMVLVPSSMELLGDRNWWLPRVIGARLPKVELETVPLGRGDAAGLEPELVGSES